MNTTIVKGVNMGELITSMDLFRRHAPSFNFEHDEAELVQVGLRCGFIKEHSETNAEGAALYELNEGYYHDT